MLSTPPHSRDLGGIGNITLNRVKRWMLRLNIIKHGLTSSRDDDAVPEFQEFEGKGKSMPADPPVIRMVRFVSFMEGPCFRRSRSGGRPIDKYIDRAFFLDRMR